MAYAVHAWALDFLGGEANRAEALADIQKAIELDDRNAIAHAYYAEILIDTGLFENYDKAAEESRVAYALGSKPDGNSACAGLCAGKYRSGSL